MVIKRIKSKISKIFNNQSNKIGLGVLSLSPKPYNTRVLFFPSCSDTHLSNDYLEILRNIAEKSQEE